MLTRGICMEASLPGSWCWEGSESHPPFKCGPVASRCFQRGGSTQAFPWAKAPLWRPSSSGQAPHTLGASLGSRRLEEVSN